MRDQTSGKMIRFYYTSLQFLYFDDVLFCLWVCDIVFDLFQD